MKNKVLFAGIDGSGKSTCLDKLISRLHSHYKIMKIGNFDPYIFYKSNKSNVLKYRPYRLIDYLRPISKKYRLYPFFLIINFLYKFMICKYLETSKDFDILMYDADILLHPAVYVTYHLPFTKILKKNIRLKITTILFGSKKNFYIFYLNTNPDIAIERIIKRGGEIHAHENIDDLKQLKKEFDNIVKVAIDNGIEVFKIDTNNRSLHEVVDEVQLLLKDKLCMPA